MRFKAIKIGKSKEEPGEEVIEANETTVTQIAEMEEQINNKTKDLEETTSKLQELSDTVNEEDETPKPHGPLSELSIEPEDKIMDIDLDMNADVSPLEGTGEEINLVEVDSQPTAPVEPQAETDTEPAVSIEKPPEVNLEDDDDSLGNLFSDDEEEENPLASLISSLPDVNAQELVDDLQEIKEIIQEWQRS